MDYDNQLITTLSALHYAIIIYVTVKKHKRNSGRFSIGPIRVWGTFGKIIRVWGTFWNLDGICEITSSLRKFGPFYL